MEMDALALSAVFGSSAGVCWTAAVPVLSVFVTVDVDVLEPHEKINGMIPKKTRHGALRLPPQAEMLNFIL